MPFRAIRRNYQAPGQAALYHLGGHVQSPRCRQNFRRHHPVLRAHQPPSRPPDRTDQPPGQIGFRLGPPCARGQHFFGCKRPNGRSRQQQRPDAHFNGSRAVRLAHAKGVNLALRQRIRHPRRRHRYNLQSPGQRHTQAIQPILYQFRMHREQKRHPDAQLIPCRGHQGHTGRPCVSEIEPEPCPAHPGCKP